MSRSDLATRWRHNLCKKPKGNSLSSFGGAGRGVVQHPAGAPKLAKNHYSQLICWQRSQYRLSIAAPQLGHFVSKLNKQLTLRLFADYSSLEVLSSVAHINTALATTALRSLPGRFEKNFYREKRLY
ncbi:hypothetical protein H2508_04540 [Parahaliea sp. F7430]|uniref:Uncharacterized protein n=1 Tax=Sediminihaliea albiluteola TaxID=2758564 RepID=A0A7W2TUU9_9GAMM|nr:hypothetical protein [Sediminihaliea albiluteola]MBA6412374.1 hypothetical protein [Sediminihaliea albiluteola]